MTNRTYFCSVVISFLAIMFYCCGCQQYPKSSLFDKKTDKGPKLAALTFDDGPYGQATIDILDILKEKNAKATFFIIGKNAEEYPDILKREIAEGHIIGNHSFNHSKYLVFLSREKLVENIKDADTAIASVSGLHPRFFRPPYGYESPFMVETINKMGYAVILWNDATEDYYMKETSQEIQERILKKLEPGAIIDLHDGRDIHTDYPRDNLIEALPVIIDKIREKGYTLVTLDKIIDQQPYFEL